MMQRTIPTATTLVELLISQADRLLDKVAFSFSYNGDDTDVTTLTYAELDIQARAVAANLVAQGAAGQRVLVFCRPGLDGIIGFFGCLYAGAIAIPVHERLAPRLSSVIPDTQAGFALASPGTSEKVTSAVDTLIGMLGRAPMRWISTDVPAADAIDWTPPAVGPDTIAMVQYTSGSTTAPKGVVLTHANLLHNLEAMRAGWGGGADDVGVFWVPQHHDMGLIGGILEMLYAGATTHLMSPSAFVQRPLRWLEAISRLRGTITAAPNFAYQLCIEASGPGERELLDLSSWKVALIGSDPIRAATLRGFAEAFAPAGFDPATFRPAYGLAETTLLVTGGQASPLPVIESLDRTALGEDRVVSAPVGDPGAVEVAGCGQLLGGSEVTVAIVDPETRRRRGPGEVGEIWVVSPSVARGYLDKPVETEQCFGAFIADTGEGPFLRTGDLGYLRDDELFVTGRCKDLVVLDGANHYPNDIEQTVQASHPALLSGRGAVFAITPSGGFLPQLVITQEVAERVGETELAQIVAAIQAGLGEQHRVQADSIVLVSAFAIPTTSSGKIQRGACRERFAEGALASLAEWHAPARPVIGSNADEARLAQIVQAAARRKAAVG